MANTRRHVRSDCCFLFCDAAIDGGWAASCDYAGCAGYDSQMSYGGQKTILCWLACWMILERNLSFIMGLAMTALVDRDRLDTLSAINFKFTTLLLLIRCVTLNFEYSRH